MSRNKGLKLASGDMIAFLDADDAWEPENLEIKVKALVSDDNVHWVTATCTLADEMLNKRTCFRWFRQRCLNSLLARKGEVMHAPSGMVLKRECITEHNSNWTRALLQSEDWDLVCTKWPFINTMEGEFLIHCGHIGVSSKYLKSRNLKNSGDAEIYWS